MRTESTMKPGVEQSGPRVWTRRTLLRSHRVLDTPIGALPRALLVLAAVLLALSLTQSLWDLTMYAPQYQDGLRLHIHASRLASGNDGQDLKEINLLNHYIGMHDLAQQNFTEFLWMPFVFGALALLLARAAVFGKVGNVLDVLVLSVYVGAFSLWSFGMKLWAYGHELSPQAPVKVPPFMPPLFGSTQLANFEVYSYPGVGAYAIIAAFVAMGVALAVSIRGARRDLAAPAA
jgi:copper chaperone NosL